MNYLAHIFLSGDDRRVQIGNFVGDAVKGRPVCFYDFVIDPGDLPFHLEVVMFEIDVLPLQAEQLASPETGCQLHVVHLEYPAVSGLSKEGVHLFNGQCFHLPMFQLRRDLLR